VASILPKTFTTDSGWGLALVLGVALVSFGLYIGWMVFMDYRDRYEPEAGEA
jgi:hypothetical protein